MNIKTFQSFLDEYIKIFNRYYYDKNDPSSEIILRDMLKNKINNYIDYRNICLIKKHIDTYYYNKKLRILDLGCGALDKTFVLRKLYPKAELYGAEAAVSDDPGHKEVNKYRFNKPRFCQILKKNYNINFSLYNGRNLHFPDEYFDIILLYTTIEHIRPWQRDEFIKKIQKKLKRDGFFIITRCPQKYGLFEIISEKIISYGAHQWRMTMNDFKRIFPNNNFRIIIRKHLNNIFTRPTFLVNKLYYLLVVTDHILTLIHWPFFSDYFLIIKKELKK